VEFYWHRNTSGEPEEFVLNSKETKVSWLENVQFDKAYYENASF